MRASGRLTVLVPLLIWLATSPDAGASGPAEPPDLFIDSIDVTVVNIDVFVTDRDGSPVTGLGREDFELLVDDRPVAISNFFAVEGGRPTSPPPSNPASKPPTEDLPPSVEPAAPAALPEAQRLHLVIYIDNSHLVSLSRNRTLQALREFLRQHLGPQDRAMIVTHEQGIHVRQPFTSRLPELIDTLYLIEPLSAAGVEYESERRDVLQLISQEQTFPSMMSRTKALAESRMSQARFAIDALREYVQMLAGLPGRKALLYVSDGLPMRAGEDLYHALHDRFHDTALLAEGIRNDLSLNYQRLIDDANAHRVTFYTLESAGLRSYSFQGAESASISGGTRIDQVQWANLRSPLLQMARQTGGQAIVGTDNQLEMLQGVGRDFSHYYSLGFVPASNDRRILHRIEVRMREKRRGVELRHRSTYREQSPESRMSDTTRAALQFGYQSNPLGAELVVGSSSLAQGSRIEEPEYDLALLVAVPIRSLVLVSRGETYQGRLRLFLGAHDPKGRLSEVQPIAVPVEIPADRLEAARDQLFTYELSVRVRSGLQRIAVGIRDENGGQASILSQEIVVQRSP